MTIRKQCQNKAAIFPMKVKIIPKTKKQVTEHIECEDHAHCFPWLSKVLCIISLFLEMKQWIKNSTCPFYTVHEKWCKINDPTFGRPQLVSSSWQCSHAYGALSKSLMQPKLQNGSRPTLQPWSLCSRLFPVPKTGSWFKTKSVWISRRNKSKKLEHKNPNFFKIIYGMPVKTEVTGIVLLQVGAILKGTMCNQICLEHITFYLTTPRIFWTDLKKCFQHRITPQASMF